MSSRIAFGLVTLTLLWPIRAFAAPPARPPSAAHDERDDADATPTTLAHPNPGAPHDDPNVGAQFHASLEEGVGVSSSDDRFALRISPTLALRSQLTHSEGETTPSADIRLARVAIGGHLFGRRVHYNVQFELAHSPKLLDAELTYAPMAELQLRVGQYRTAFSREFITPIVHLMLPGRSLVSDYFRADRNVGATLQGHVADGRFEYYLGAFADPALHGEASRMVLGRLVYAPLGAMPYDETMATLTEGPPRFALAVGAYRDQRTQHHSEFDTNSGEFVVLEDPDLVRSAINADFALRSGRLFVSGEVFADWREQGGVQSRGFGGYLQSSVALWHRRLDVVGRFDVLATDLDEHGLHGLRRYTLGANGYFAGNSMKLQLRYAYTDVDDDAPTNLPIALSSHELTLQLQLTI